MKLLPTSYSAFVQRRPHKQVQATESYIIANSHPFLRAFRQPGSNTVQRIQRPTAYLRPVASMVLKESHKTSSSSSSSSKMKHLLGSQSRTTPAEAARVPVAGKVRSCNLVVCLRSLTGEKPRTHNSASGLCNTDNVKQLRLFLIF